MSTRREVAHGRYGPATVQWQGLALRVDLEVHGSGWHYTVRRRVPRPDARFTHGEIAGTWDGRARAIVHEAHSGNARDRAGVHSIPEAFVVLAYELGRTQARGGEAGDGPWG